MATDQAGTPVEDVQVYPWGQTWHYTGNEWPGIYAGLDSFLCQLQPCPDQSQTRDYFPSFGRWLTPDPAEVAPSPDDPQTWNMYAYAGNNPTTNTDPTGEACVQGSAGNYFDDNSGGQTCAEVDADNAQQKPSVTVSGQEFRTGTAADGCRRTASWARWLMGLPWPQGVS